MAAVPPVPSVVILYLPGRPGTTSERETANHDPDRGAVVVVVILCQDMPAAALLAAERPFASASTTRPNHTPLSVLSRHKPSLRAPAKRMCALYCTTRAQTDGPVDVYVPALGEIPVAEEAPLQERAARDTLNQHGSKIQLWTNVRSSYHWRRCSACWYFCASQQLLLLLRGRRPCLKDA